MQSKNIWQKKIPIVGAVIVVMIVVDQWTKILARDWLAYKGAKNFLGGLLVFQYALNRGAFLSLGDQLPEFLRQGIFTFGVAVILGFAIYYLFRYPWERYQVLSYALVIGGGLSNLYDRIFRGAVIDFINMGIGSLRTGIFNVADMGITAGVLVIFFTSLGGKKTLEEATPKL